MAGSDNHVNMNDYPELSATSDENPLFSPVRVGRHTLSHRVVLAPLTRCRALNNLPQLAHLEYYRQRASPGGLLISEGVGISPQAFGFPHTPGIFNEEQIQAWRLIVEGVHAKGGIIFCQLWHVGRASHTYYQPKNVAPISSTNKRVPKEWKITLPHEVAKQPVECSQPRALTIPEIKNVVEEFRQAARNAIIAGFDGVEIHGAHGYLIDQFLKEGINDREDEYGGCVENRCRMALEVVRVVAEEVGWDRTALRLSPINNHMGAIDKNPRHLISHLITQLNNSMPPNENLAYLHITNPAYMCSSRKQHDHHPYVSPPTLKLYKHFASLFHGIVINSGSFNQSYAIFALRHRLCHLVGFGRLFISNPDLPYRLFHNTPLNPYNRFTFYTPHQIQGYTNYPFLSTIPNENQDEEVYSLPQVAKFLISNL